MHQGKITRQIISAQYAAVCKTVRKSVVERNKPCYNDVDFCNNTFVHEDGNMR